MLGKENIFLFVYQHSVPMNVYRVFIKINTDNYILLVTLILNRLALTPAASGIYFNDSPSIDVIL